MSKVPEASKVHYFGIRHHGPGCARSLVRAFEQLQPDCVLVEGPPEAEGVLAALLHEQMQPPVALLSYCPDAPARAVYHPFAVFSPEWQALRWALAQQVAVSFIDLPLTHQLALAKAREEEQAQAQAAAEEEAEAAAAQAAERTDDTDDTDAAVEVDAAVEAVEAVAAAEPHYRSDPLDWLAQAAGHADGESWWNHTVEERGDGEALFAAIAEAMTTLRADLGAQAEESCPYRARRELLREAHMRQRIREAVKKGHERIAVVCGAWHLGGLQAR